MALLSQKDVKDVRDLVTKKLELYCNREKRENGFNPSGSVRTTHKMFKYDFMYKVLEYDNWDKDSPRYPKRKSKSSKSRTTEHDRHHGTETNNQKDKNDPNIDPKVDNTSRRMVLYKEVDRLASNATKVFKELPIDKLQVIHRYRPSYSIEDTPETGKVQNYTRHVGAVLKSQDYVNYYIKEGLQTGNSSKSKSLQKHEDDEKEEKDEENNTLKEKLEMRKPARKDETKWKENERKKQNQQKKVPAREPTIKVEITKRS